MLLSFQSTSTLTLTRPLLQDQQDRFNCLSSYLNYAPSSTYSRAFTNNIWHIGPTIEHGKRSRVQTVV